MTDISEIIHRLEGHMQTHEEIFIQIQEENEDLKRIIKELYKKTRERQVIL